MFVNKVKVPEAVNIAGSGVVANGMTLIGVASPTRMCHGAAIARKSRMPVKGLNSRQRRH